MPVDDEVQQLDPDDEPDEPEVEDDEPAADDGLTEEQRMSAFEALNALRSIQSPAMRARAWVDATDDERSVWRKLGEIGPLHDEPDGQPHIGEGHPGYESAMASTERTNLETLPKIYSGQIWTDSETYETVADLAEEVKQIHGDERDAAVQRLARILSRLELATRGAPAFGQVVQTESMLGADGRRRFIETDHKGQRRITVSSREDTERSMAEAKAAVAEGREPNPEPVSAELATARKAVDEGRPFAALFEQIPSQTERQAFMRGLSPDQERALESELGRRA